MTGAESVPASGDVPLGPGDAPPEADEPSAAMPAGGAGATLDAERPQQPQSPVGWMGPVIEKVREFRGNGRTPHMMRSRDRSIQGDIDVALDPLFATAPTTFQPVTASSRRGRRRAVDAAGGEEPTRD